MVAELVGRGEGGRDLARNTMASRRRSRRPISGRRMSPFLLTRLLIDPAELALGDVAVVAV